MPLRALLALYGDVLSQTAHRDLDHRCRDMARALAGTREIQAMLDSIAHLEARFGRGRQAGGVLTALRTTLDEQRRAASDSGAAASPPLAGLHGDLEVTAGLLAALEIEQDGYLAIRGGLERTYRASRRWRGQAYADGADETFHEWRKHLQRHWRHMQLLLPAWPQQLQPRARMARDISEILGQDHDLAVLGQHLGKAGRSLGTAAQVRACRALCRRLQTELRSAVRADGERLFSEPAKAFGARIGGYWEITRRQAEGDEGTQTLPPGAPGSRGADAA